MLVSHTAVQSVCTYTCDLIIFVGNIPVQYSLSSVSVYLITVGIVQFQIRAAYQLCGRQSNPVQSIIRRKIIVKIKPCVNYFRLNHGEQRNIKHH